MNSDGGGLFSLPESMTDQQVWEAFRMANYAYSQEFECGKDEKINEIRRVLGL